MFQGKYFRGKYILKNQPFAAYGEIYAFAIQTMFTQLEQELRKIVKSYEKYWDLANI